MGEGEAGGEEGRRIVEGCNAQGERDRLMGALVERVRGERMGGIKKGNFMTEEGGARCDYVGLVEVRRRASERSKASCRMGYVRRGGCEYVSWRCVCIMAMCMYHGALVCIMALCMYHGAIYQGIQIDASLLLARCRARCVTSVTATIFLAHF
jgi:hypothetical protein